ncbi:hypothetical protein [Viridibacillus arvi]|uniref:hypothetical protein n=1 Tax=Viridibacillus arvi TaxID=263475 RepID=UPI0034CF2EA3
MNKSNFWFYILKGIDSEGYSYNVETNVFIADTRAAAKSKLSEMYSQIPFRKPKLFDENTRYIYLIPSTEYWYDYHNKAFDVVCECCANVVTVIGQKNIIKNRFGEFCSIECKEQREREVGDNSDYINENDHFGLANRQREEVTGYIYKITNKHSIQCYVGQTVKPALFRWWQHLKIDKKFGQVDIADLVFEVLEVVTFSDADKEEGFYTTAKDKLNKREAYYIKLFDCVEEGFNTVQPKEFEHDLFSIAQLSI